MTFARFPDPVPTMFSLQLLFGRRPVYQLLEDAAAKPTKASVGHRVDQIPASAKSGRSYTRAPQGEKDCEQITAELVKTFVTVSNARTLRHCRGTSQNSKTVEKLAERINSAINTLKAWIHPAD